MKTSKFLTLFLVALGAGPLPAESLSGGNLTVNATADEPGDLTVEGGAHISGSLDLGTTSTSQSAILFSYTENGTTRSLDMTATPAGTAFLWQDDAGGSTRKKMCLDAANALSLYDPATGNAKISLNPASGRLSLIGAGSGIVLSDNTVIGSGVDLQSQALYDNNGTARITFDANGNMIVSAPSTFQQGITVEDVLKFGNGTQLNQARAENLVNVLNNLGYGDNPSGAWTSKFGMSASGHLNICKLAITESGSLWIAGTFSGTLKVPRHGYAYSYTAKGPTDVFVAQLDAREPGSDVLNIYLLDGTGEETVRDLAFGKWNAPYVVGTFKGVLKPYYGRTSISSVGTTSDVFLANVGYSGWVRRLGTTAADDVSALGIDAANGLYLGGTYSGNFSYGGASPLISGGGTDGYLIKLDAATGNPVWAKSLGGMGSDSLVDLAVERTSGALFVTGMFGGTASFGAAGSLVNTGSQDVFLARLNFNGDSAWARQISSTGSVWATALACDAAGNVFHTGAVYGTATFPNVSNPPPAVTSEYDYDGYQLPAVMVSKVSLSGAVEWFKGFGNDNTVYAFEIAISSSGNAFVSGQMEWYYYEDAGSDPFLAMVDGASGAVSFTKYYAGYSSRLQALAAGAGKLGLVTYFNEKRTLDESCSRPARRFLSRAKVACLKWLTTPQQKASRGGHRKGPAERPHWETRPMRFLSARWPREGEPAARNTASLRARVRLRGVIPRRWDMARGRADGARWLWEAGALPATMRWL